MEHELSERENRSMPLGEALQRLRATAEQQKAKPTQNLPALRVVEAMPAKPSPPRITKAELARLLGPLEVIYGSRALSETETKMKYQIFYAVLGHLPERTVALAVERYVKHTNPVYDYFPKPAKLLELSK